MTIKRVLLLVLTVVALIPVLVSLIASVSQPQVQANLQLYQTDLILQASQWQPAAPDSYLSNSEWQEIRRGILGNDPYSTAQNQYSEARKVTQKNISNLTAKLKSTLSIAENTPITPSKLVDLAAPSDSSQSELVKQIKQQQDLVNKIDLKLGIIQVKTGHLEQAINTWDNLINSDGDIFLSAELFTTTSILKDLWRNHSGISPTTESIVNSNLKGWFRYLCLDKFYQVTNQQNKLLSLSQQEQKFAREALIKLAVVGGLPFLSGLIGVGLFIFLLIQILINKKAAILAPSSYQGWETPWTGETLWQVLIVGFFFVGQILLPLLFGLSFSILGINPAGLSIRLKSVYVLASYITMSLAGIGVLYWSIKSFFPLPRDWFKFQCLSNWFVWGIGGYLIAIPLVILVSLINQQIWQGQGGSNPLLMLALESQDRVALAILFITAAVAAPGFEEIMFRGFLLPSLTKYVPVWAAIGISSFVFALAHLNLSEVLPLATLGVILGMVYTRSRNLLASMLLHSLWNSGTLLSLFILGSGAG
jgi:membrane protease YdiL (CAAX protease family)